MPLTQKEISKLFLNSSSMKNYSFPGIMPIGITRFEVFLAIAPILKGRKYWQALRNSYIMSDNLYEYRIDVRMAFMSTESDRISLMTKKEVREFEKLPEMVKIYRGASIEEEENDDYGISWTLSLEKAHYFAFVYPRNVATHDHEKSIYERVVPKSKLLAYFKERGEEEVIYIENENWINFEDAN